MKGWYKARCLIQLPSLLPCGLGGALERVFWAVLLKQRRAHNSEKKWQEFQLKRIVQGCSREDIPRAWGWSKSGDRCGEHFRERTSENCDFLDCGEEKKRKGSGDGDSLILMPQRSVCVPAQFSDSNDLGNGFHDVVSSSLFKARCFPSVY